MSTTAGPATPLGVNVDDLGLGSMRLARAGDRRLCLVRTSDGVYALDHACPHEGYGLTQGTLDGNLLTCAWHNWKFRVDDGGVRARRGGRPEPSGDRSPPTAPSPCRSTIPTPPSCGRG